WQQARTRVVLGRAWAALGETDRARREWRTALAAFDDLGTAEADDVRALLAPGDLPSGGLPSGGVPGGGLSDDGLPSGGLPSPTGTSAR
ncbi:hypothetical protein AB0J52_37100, partial [Spirillospora sp. NPDC049652]